MVAVAANAGTKGSGMRLTRQTNYAVRILMYCEANKGKLSHVPEIASAYNVSELFLFKILKPLVENGFIETVRGRNGGVRLAKPATDISLFDVVRVTEDNFAMAECFENDAADCPLVDSCGMNAALREALGAFFEVLSRYSIDDLVKARPNIATVLGIPLLKSAAA
jgi:Rrf2 family protein